MNDEAAPDRWQLEVVVSALMACAEHHELNAGASEDEILLAEAHLGRRLPPELRSLYERSNGAGLLQGNLNVYPLRAAGGDVALVTESCVPLADELREWEWRLPEELLVFGDNGGDEMFGLWLPTDRPGLAAPVIEIAEGGEPAVEKQGLEGLAVAGTGIVSFLATRTAYYALLLGAGAEVLEKLGVPAALRDREPDDRLFVELLAWGDHGLPNSDPHPYQRPIGAARLRELYGGAEP